MYVATGGPNVKWGGTDLKWGGRAPLAPAGDGPGGISLLSLPGRVYTKIP